MCSIIEMPRSTYYSKVNSKRSNREIENEVIKENINISLKKVQRLMKNLGIRSITIKNIERYLAKNLKKV